MYTGCGETKVFGTFHIMGASFLVIQRYLWKKVQIKSVNIQHNGSITWVMNMDVIYGEL